MRRLTEKSYHFFFFPANQQRLKSNYGLSTTSVWIDVIGSFWRERMRELYKITVVGPGFLRGHQVSSGVEQLLLPTARECNVFRSVCQSFCPQEGGIGFPACITGLHDQGRGLHPGAGGLHPGRGRSASRG